jgi:uncharacterized membrane protein
MTLPKVPDATRESEMAMTTPQPATASDPRTYALIVWVLYLAGFFTAFLSTFIGFVIAVVKRSDLAGTPFGSHMTYAVRTFLGALVVSIGCGVLFFVSLLQQANGALVLPVVLASGALMAAVSLWSLFRSLKGLILALDGRSVEEPHDWL